MHRTAVDLSALLLSITGASALAIPPSPPDDVRVVQVLDGHTNVVAPYGDPFFDKGGTGTLLLSITQRACVAFTKSRRCHRSTRGRSSPKPTTDRLRLQPHKAGQGTSDLPHSGHAWVGRIIMKRDNGLAFDHFPQPH